ncbi:hypothetical protein LINGRAHAP2_LOCUS16048 [Linum grandiflorum]
MLRIIWLILAPLSRMECICLTHQIETCPINWLHYNFIGVSLPILVRISNNI